MNGMICAAVPAAGAGTRARFDKNKVFCPVGGVPVLARTVARLADCPRIQKIAVAVADAERDAAKEMLAAYADKLVFARGGATRALSVKSALEALEPFAPDVVLVHDAARPFVTRRILDECIDTALACGSAVCALPCTDTLVRAQEGHIAAAYDRATAYTLQTPQGFSFPALLGAYRRMTDGDAFTDDSGVYAKYVAPPRLFRGDPCNRKLTFSEDFSVREFRTGIGIDTHAFAKEGDRIVLGGVHIPCAARLLAHSDGDVLAHAVMDALLSAAGLADIGHLFPDTDPAYADADSLLLLKEVVARVRGEGFAVQNVSAAIVAQRPKLAPHVPAMKQNLARALGVSENCVGITAGTNEGLGALGRGEGITVTATALLGTQVQG